MNTVEPRIYLENGWIKCKLPYDQERTPKFAKELKERISWKFRQYSPSEKAWMIDPYYKDDLIAIAVKYFPNIKVDGKSQNQQKQEPAQQSGPKVNGTYHSIAALLRVASSDSLKRIYKILAADLHTDKGGDEETMKQLNIAWDSIRKERCI